MVDAIVADISLLYVSSLTLSGYWRCKLHPIYYASVSAQCEEFDLFHDHYATFRVASFDIS